VERAEVEGDGDAEMLRDPARELVDLEVGVVEVGDEERRDLGPDVRLVDEVLECLEYGSVLRISSRLL
jgi:hypothetical protein